MSLPKRSRKLSLSYHSSEGSFMHLSRGVEPRARGTSALLTVPDSSPEMPPRKVSPVKGKGKRQSISFRTKTFLTSKVLGNRYGQKIFLNELRSEERLLLEILCSNLKEFYPGEAGEALYSNLLKILSKTIRMVVQLRLFQHKHSKIVEKPLHDLCFEALYSPLIAVPEKIKEQAIRMQSAILKAADTYRSMVASLLTEKNRNVLEEVIAGVSNAQFLEHVMREIQAKGADNATYVRQLLLTTMNRYELSVGVRQVYCIVPYCGKKVVTPFGLFKGTQFCPRHHNSRYSQLWKDVGVVHFVENVPFREYLENYFINLNNNRQASELQIKGHMTSVESGDAFLLYTLLNFVNDYTTSFDWYQRKGTATYILKKLVLPLKEKGLIQEEDLPTGYAALSDVGEEEALPLTLFAGLYEALLATFAPAFEGFMRSREFQRFKYSFAQEVDETEETFEFQF